jgi:hypothetical protein
MRGEATAARCRTPCNWNKWRDRWRLGWAGPVGDGWRDRYEGGRSMSQGEGSVTRSPLHRRWVLDAEAAGQVDRDGGDSDG